VEELKHGRFDENEVFRRVLDYALSTGLSPARNPAVVFTHILKKELKYVPDRKV
jgi:hypothetical protein